MGCSSGQFVAHVLFYVPWTSLRWTSLCPRPPCAGSRCVVWCVFVVLCCVSLLCCVQNFRGCVQDMGAPPDSLSADSPLPSLQSPTAQNFAFLFSSPLHFALFLSLGVFSWNVGGVFESMPTIRDPDLTNLNQTGFGKKSRTMLKAQKLSRHSSSTRTSTALFQRRGRTPMSQTPCRRPSRFHIFRGFRRTWRFLR